MVATDMGDTTLVELLTKYEADVNRQDNVLSDTATH